MTPIRLLIADDDADVRGALSDLIAAEPSIDIVGIASTTDEAIALTTSSRPDVALLDVKMPGGGGQRAAAVIRKRHPRTRIVALSAYQDRSTVLEMLKSGAVGYVSKGSSATEVLAAIEQAANGFASLSPGASSELVSELSGRLRAEDEAAAASRRRTRRVQAAIGGRLQAVYQPIVELQTGHVTGVEALARFGDDGPTPDVWFREAEEVGLLLELEEAAFRTAVAGLDRLPASMFMTVNMAPQAALRTDLLRALDAERTRRLVLELTEHAPVDDYDALREALAPWRSHEGRVAVDDAGAGFASLRHILLLEADIIKLDACLVQDIHRNAGQRALASALISFAAQTGAVVVAEGVESVADLAEVQALGAGYAQGYLLGRPAALDDIDFAPRAVVDRVSHAPAPA